MTNNAEKNDNFKKQKASKKVKKNPKKLILGCFYHNNYDKKK